MSEMVWPFSKSDTTALDTAVKELVTARADRMVAQERLLNALQAVEAGAVVINGGTNGEEDFQGVKVQAHGDD